ncbi:MAG TPA: hypothetical protein DDX89_00080 [Candidatus Omnitrophica bacterium]|nr:hypothetical protein [Candidatus Omnitrophota bacterium]
MRQTIRQKRFTGATTAAMCVFAVLSMKALFAAEAREWECVDLGGGGNQWNMVVSPHDDNLLFTTIDMGSMFRSEDGGKNWTMIDTRKLTNASYSQTVFHPKNPNTVFVGSTQGLQVSRDRGKTWDLLAPSPPWNQEYVSALYVAWEKPDLMFAGTQSGAWQSEDGGKQWRKCDGVSGGPISAYSVKAMIVSFLVLGEARFAATDQGVYRSDDAGVTWTLKNKGITGKVAAFCGGANQEKTALYCVAGGQVHRSFDLGESWEPTPRTGIDRNAPDGKAVEFTRLVCAENHPEAVYTGIWVYKTTDYGTTWALGYRPIVDYAACTPNPDYRLSYLDYDITPWWSGPMLKRMGIHRRNPDFVLGGNSGHTIVSRDGGKIWEQLCSRPIDGYKKGGRWATTGVSVTGAHHYYVDPHDKNRHYICYTDISFGRSEDGGKTWYRSAEGNPWSNAIYDLAFDMEKPGVLYAAASLKHDIPHWTNIESDSNPKYFKGGVLKSADYGKTWQPIGGGLPEKPATSIIKDGDTLYVTMYGDGLYRSDDGGQTWTKKSNGLGQPGNLHVYYARKHKDGTLFCLITASRKDPEMDFPVPGGLYRSSDKGESWALVRAHRWPMGFGVHPDDSKIIYLATAAIPRGQESDGVGGIYRTTDGGQNWTPCELNFAKRTGSPGYKHCFGVFFEPGNPEHVFATVETHGVSESLDGGKMWKEFDGPPFYCVQRVFWYDASVYFCTFGGGGWKTKR